MADSSDFYVDDDGMYVMTAAFHLRRGYCCGNRCKHCPYDHVNVPGGKQQSEDD
ncbi:DUF5522 domain-containing protein [Lewinella sp. W8]|uniref:DUF5522 domain-containing protein n=1 Tax=Lewinella sp. W8 TaxID=2528208 RepID=UPI001566F691|nr:DUF5522 domain-containing protein [Lewinella sp. W8]